QLLWGFQGSDLAPLPVVQNPDLQNTAYPAVIAAAGGADLVPSENSPDSGNPGGLVPQHPLPADSHMAEPDAVFLNILVHHGKQLPDRGRLLRVGQLDADGLRQTA